MGDSLYSTLQSATREFEDWSKVPTLSGRNIHVAVMSEPYLSLMFSGRKTIESRFTVNKIVPYGKADIGDIVFLKHGPIVGYFIVSWVKCIDLTKYPIDAVAEEYSEAICVDGKFWRDNNHKRYATLLGVSNVHHLTPLPIVKHDRRAWLTLV